MRKLTQIRFYNNLNDVSLFFMCLLGPLHFLSGLLYAQNQFLKTAFLTNRLLDIPFLAAFLCFVMSHIKIKKLYKNQNSSKFDFFFTALIITILTLCLTFDIFFEHYLPLAQ